MDYSDFIIEYEGMLYFLALCIFLGAELIANVPAILHTPLMSGANAISGVILLGAIAVVSSVPPDNYFGLVLGFIAIVLGTINIAGGFFVTDRMLRMFKTRD